MEILETPWTLRTQGIADLQAKFACTHENTQLSQRLIRNGGIQYVRQCQHCGIATTSPIKRADAIYQNGGSVPQPFDDGLLDGWDHVKSEAYRAVDAEYASRINALANPNASPDDEWRIKYNCYLQSSQWAKKRELVLARAKGICEGCGENTAAEVHHLTYENMGSEFLFELVALCKTCHETLHERRHARKAL